MPPEDVNADVVRTRLFELVADEGRPRARMAPKDDADSVGLEFYERDGTQRLRLPMPGGVSRVAPLLRQPFRADRESISGCAARPAPPLIPSLPCCPAGRRAQWARTPATGALR